MSTLTSTLVSLAARRRDGAVQRVAGAHRADGARAGLANTKTVAIAADGDAIKVTTSTKKGNQPAKATRSFSTKKNARRALVTIAKEVSGYRSDLKVRRRPAAGQRQRQRQEAPPLVVHKEGAALRWLARRHAARRGCPAQSNGHWPVACKPALQACPASSQRAAQRSPPTTRR
jgi:hypothetical protein